LYAYIVVSHSNIVAIKDSSAIYIFQDKPVGTDVGIPDDKRSAGNRIVEPKIPGDGNGSTGKLGYYVKVRMIDIVDTAVGYPRACGKGFKAFQHILRIYIHLMIALSFKK
jgi:hypothetical protein